MRLGDLLEWLAAIALVAAAYLWHHSLPQAFVVAAICLFYLGQCYGGQSVKLRTKDKQ